MKMINILEKAWLVIAILAICIGTFMLIKGAKEDAIYFYVFTLVAGIFYFIRRKQRIRMHSEQNQKKQQQSN
jgi:hypothetical protein